MNRADAILRGLLFGTVVVCGISLKVTHEAVQTLERAVEVTRKQQELITLQEAQIIQLKAKEPKPPAGIPHVMIEPGAARRPVNSWGMNP